MARAAHLKQMLQQKTMHRSSSQVLRHVAAYCSVLKYMTVRCAMLHCVALCCSYVALCCSAGVQGNAPFFVAGTAACCSVLQCVAVRCSVLQCVAVCCSVLLCVAVLEYPAMDRFLSQVLQHVAVCCSVF